MRRGRGGVQSSERGIALIVVLAVLLALLLVAVPFARSMVLQERTSTTFKAGREAQWAAEGARNFGVAWMLPGHDFSERRSPQRPFDTPFHDTADEFLPWLEDPRLSRQLPVSDPSGRIWGVTVRDEQGKINLRTAPTALVRRVLDSIDTRITDPREFFTLHSMRDAEWIEPRKIRGISDPSVAGVIVTCCGKTEPFVLVDSSQHYAAGRVRLSKPGLPPVVRRMVGAGGGRFACHDDVSHALLSPAYDGGIAEIEARHPVNVNTTTKPILTALLEGLTIPDEPPQGNVWRVSRAAAERVAEALLRTPVRSWEELESRVLAAPVDPKDRTAILENARSPSSTQLGFSGTMPLGFLSEGVASIESAGSVNNPSGVPRAGRSVREVVRMAPVDPVDRRWECQYDFDRQLRWANQKGLPFGNRMTTFPSPSGVASERVLRDQQRAGSEAWLQLEPSRDLRGTAQFINTREHYDAEIEGREVGVGGQSWAWDQVFHPGAPQPAMPDVTAGGTEFWVRFHTVTSPISLFDIREAEFENRISLRFEAGELIFAVSDAAAGVLSEPIDNGLAEIRRPFNPVADTWYHIGAYWKGTRYAHLALLVDGFSHPSSTFRHVDENNRTILTELPSAVDDTNNQFTLADESFLADGTPIQIGQEVILLRGTVDPTSGARVHVRGARGTTAAAHVGGAKVQVFGYCSRIRNDTWNTGLSNPSTISYDRITIGGGTVSVSFGGNPQADVEGDKTDSNTGTRYIDDTQNFIRATSSAIADFPTQGYILIEQEVIYYDGLNTASPQFTGCQRGQHGTTAVRHDSGANIRMWAVPVSTYGSAASDDQYLTPTVIQIDGEWIGPVQKDPTRQGFWISFVDAGTPIRLLRGNFGTGSQAHSVGAAVIPTWLAQESDPNVSRANCGSGDRVTLLNANGQKSLLRIRHAWSSGNLQMTAFDQNVSAVHVADGLHVRVLKFPSGELLGLEWLQRTNPSFQIGPFGGTIDEVKFFASPKGNFLTVNPVSASTGGTVDLNGVGGLQGGGGAVKVGDEIIGYAQLQTNTLAPATRGWLNSTAQVHDAGDYVFALSFLPISSLSQSVNEADGALPVRQRLSGNNYGQGYAFVEGEVVLFERNQNLVAMPLTHDGSRGLYRGRFGTTPTSHAQNALVYGIPWRYWDTYVPQQFDNTMAYAQFSATLPDARVRRIRWDARTIPDDPNVLLHILTRLDQQGEFTDAPGAGQSNLLWGFPAPAGEGRFDEVLHRNGQVDLRFYTEFRPGSFYPADSWKRTPRLYEIRVEYEQKTKVLFHEDR